MRDFNDKDRVKKSQRLKIGENPADLAPEMLALLGSAIKAALKDGYLPCPIGWRIAKDAAVPRIVLGAVMDKLGVRIANCQLGFFRVDKTLQLDTAEQKPSPEMTAALNGLDAAVNLTCSTAFELARLLKTTPMKVSEAASALGLKIRSCQLGCF
jgi:hypothetical protein